MLMEVHPSGNAVTALASFWVLFEKLTSKANSREVGIVEWGLIIWKCILKPCNNPGTE